MAEEARFVRVGREVQRTLGCWRSRAGAYGAVVIPVTAGRMLVLSERSQLSESLAEECEAVGEARPHAEWPGSVFFIGATTGVSC